MPSVSKLQLNKNLILRTWDHDCHQFYEDLEKRDLNSFTARFNNFIIRVTNSGTLSKLVGERLSTPDNVAKGR